MYSINIFEPMNELLSKLRPEGPLMVFWHHTKFYEHPLLFDSFLKTKISETKWGKISKLQKTESRQKRGDRFMVNFHGYNK